MEQLIGTVIGAILTFALGYWKYKNEKKKIDAEVERIKLENAEIKTENEDVKYKLNFLDRVMELSIINEIGDAVEQIFDTTKADRFLILIARNGVSDFKIVNVIFEQHKNKKYKINAIARYRNVGIDSNYREMLKEAEFKGLVNLEVSKMKPCLLKDFYETEGVKFSKIRHLARKPIDNDNDFLVFSSLSTHESRNFNRKELAFINTQYEGTIKPALEKLMN